MTMLKYVLFALVLLKIVEAYTAISRSDKKPAKFADQEGCYLSEFDRVLEIGVPFTPTNSSCEKYVCGGDSSMIDIEGCSSKLLPEYCKEIPRDFTKPFPDCCQKYQCTLPNGEVINM